MPNIGPGELILILLVALIVFGPRKLPELGKSLGAGLREFRKTTQGLRDEFDGTVNGTASTGGVSAQTAAPQTIHRADAVAAQPVSAHQMMAGPVQPASVPPVSAQSVAAQPVSAQAVVAQPVPAEDDKA